MAGRVIQHLRYGHGGIEECLHAHRVFLKQLFRGGQAFFILAVTIQFVKVAPFIMVGKGSDIRLAVIGHDAFLPCHGRIQLLRRESCHLLLDLLRILLGQLLYPFPVYRNDFTVVLGLCGNGHTYKYYYK